MHSTGTFEQLSDSPIQGFHGMASFKEYLDTKMSFDYLFIHTLYIPQEQVNESVPSNGKN